MVWIKQTMRNLDKVPEETKQTHNPAKHLCAAKKKKRRDEWASPKVWQVRRSASAAVWSHAFHRQLYLSTVVCTQCTLTPDDLWRVNNVSNNNCSFTHSQWKGSVIGVSFDWMSELIHQIQFSSNEGYCVNVLDQGCQTYGPRAKSDRLGWSNWPTFWK